MGKKKERETRENQDSDLPGNQQKNKKLRLQLKRNKKLKRKTGEPQSNRSVSAFSKCFVTDESFNQLYGKIDSGKGKESNYDFDVDFA